MKKYIVSIVFFAIIFSIFVSADSGRKLFVYYTDPLSETVTVEIKLSDTKDIGGLDFDIYFDENDWEFVSNSIVNNNELSVNLMGNKVRCIWENDSQKNLNNPILNLYFKRVGKPVNVDGINLTINDCYDSKIAMNDIPLSIQYNLKQSYNKQFRPVYIVAIILLFVAVIALICVLKRKKGR